MNTKIELILLADKLDRVGLSTEANTVDVLIKQGSLEGSRMMEMHEGLRAAEQEMDKMLEQAVSNPDANLDDHFREYFTEGFSAIRDILNRLRESLDLPEGDGDHFFMMGEGEGAEGEEWNAEPSQPTHVGHGHQRSGGPTFSQTLSNVGNINLRDLLRENKA